MKLGYFYHFCTDIDDFLSEIILVYPTQQFTVGGKYFLKVNFLFKYHKELKSKSIKRVGNFW